MATCPAGTAVASEGHIFWSWNLFHSTIRGWRCQGITTKVLSTAALLSFLNLQLIKISTGPSVQKSGPFGVGILCSMEMVEEVVRLREVSNKQKTGKLGQFWTIGPHEAPVSWGWVGSACASSTKIEPTLLLEFTAEKWVLKPQRGWWKWFFGGRLHNSGGYNAWACQQGQNWNSPLLLF